MLIGWIQVSPLCFIRNNNNDETYQLSIHQKPSVNQHRCCHASLTLMLMLAFPGKGCYGIVGVSLGYRTLYCLFLSTTLGWWCVQSVCFTDVSCCLNPMQVTTCHAFVLLYDYVDREFLFHAATQVPWNSPQRCFIQTTARINYKLNLCFTNTNPIKIIIWPRISPISLYLHHMVLRGTHRCSNTIV